MKLETRVFICFLLTLIFILCTGCHSTKYQWLPEDKPTPNKYEKETGVIKGTIVKISVSYTHLTLPTILLV